MLVENSLDISITASDQTLRGFISCKQQLENLSCQQVATLSNMKMLITQVSLDNCMMNSLN